MAPTDRDGSPRPIGRERMDECLALSAEAGWNQTSDDWDLFFRHGTVFGIDDAARRLVATGALLPYAGRFAWISMVLVSGDQRGQGLGTRILERCVGALSAARLVPALDATPAGERVYRPMGFLPVFGLKRWTGRGGPAPFAPRGSTGEPRGAPRGPAIRRLRAEDADAIARLDETATGGRRAFLLQSLLRRAPALAFTAEDHSGFVLARPGRVATQIGPVTAAGEETAAALLEAALDAAEGPVLLDVADGWERLAARLREREFTVQRPYLRMALGQSTPFGDAGRTFVIAGPELG